MPNLNLTHSGNMSITSASITSGGTLNVGYQANDTGYITGWTITPAPGDTDYETGETISLKFYPQYSGTVLSETFVVSGVDNARVNRSDSSVLTQDYNRDLSTYFSGVSGYWYYMSTYDTDLVSTAVTENYLEVVIQPNNLANPGDYIFFGISSNTTKKYAGAFWNGWIKTPPAPLSSITLNLPSYHIVGSGTATTTYSPSSAYVNLRYDTLYQQYATIDQNTGVISVRQNGWCQFMVTDLNTGLSDMKGAYVWVEGTEFATSLTLNVPNVVYDSATATTTLNPSNATAWLSYSILGDGGNYAYIDQSTGEITAYSDGTVTVKVVDNITGLQDTKQVDIEKGGYYFIVYYNVTSTTEPTWIGSEPYSWGDTAQILSARLEDGTLVPLNYDNHCLYYTFPETGIHAIKYRVNESRIPDGAFAFWTGYSPYPITSLVAVDATDIEEIGKSAFFHLDNSLTSVTFGKVEVIDTDAFLGDYSITGDLVFPESLTTINGLAFDGCYGLTSVTFPSGVTYIGVEAFIRCSGLTYMEFTGTVPPTLPIRDTYYAKNLGEYEYTFPIYVPDSAVNTYKTAGGAWDYYVNRIYPVSSKT